jgi:hypothetical protein
VLAKSSRSAQRFHPGRARNRRRRKQISLFWRQPAATQPSAPPPAISPRSRNRRNLSDTVLCFDFVAFVIPLVVKFGCPHKSATISLSASFAAFALLC